MKHPAQAELGRGTHRIVSHLVGQLPKSRSQVPDFDSLSRPALLSAQHWKGGGPMAKSSDCSHKRLNSEVAEA